MQSISGLELTSWMLRSITPKHASRLSVPSIDLISSRLTRPCRGSAGSLNGDGPVPKPVQFNCGRADSLFETGCGPVLGHAGRGLLSISWSSDNANHLFINSVDEGSGGFSWIGTYLTSSGCLTARGWEVRLAEDDPGRVEEGQCSGRLPPSGRGGGGHAPPLTGPASGPGPRPRGLSRRFRSRRGSALIARTAARLERLDALEEDPDGPILVAAGEAEEERLPAERLVVRQVAVDGEAVEHRVAGAREERRSPSGVAERLRLGQRHEAGVRRRPEILKGDPPRIVDHRRGVPGVRQIEVLGKFPAAESPPERMMRLRSTGRLAIAALTWRLTDRATERTADGPL